MVLYICRINSDHFWLFRCSLHRKIDAKREAITTVGTNIIAPGASKGPVIVYGEWGGGATKWENRRSENVSHPHLPQDRVKVFAHTHTHTF